MVRVFINLSTQFINTQYFLSFGPVRKMILSGTVIFFWNITRRSSFEIINGPIQSFGSGILPGLM